METLAIPAGFDRHYRQSPLTDPWEPLYSRKTDGAVVLGLEVTKAHTNRRGFVHGGTMSPGSTVGAVLLNVWQISEK